MFQLEVSFSASDSCEIPCNEQQVMKLKGRMKSSSIANTCAPI